MDGTRCETAGNGVNSCPTVLENAGSRSGIRSPSTPHTPSSAVWACWEHVEEKAFSFELFLRPFQHKALLCKSPNQNCPSFRAVSSWQAGLC